MNRLHRFSMVICSTALIAGCAGTQHLHHAPLYSDPSNPLKRVAVLPLKNDTTDVGGTDLVRKKMIEALTGKSYIVKDVKETDQILRDQMGITLGGQLEMTTPQKLGEALGVEGVLYGTLMDFDETTTGLLDVRKVRAKFRLVNAATGQAIWERGLGVRTETRMAGRSGTAASLLNRASDARDKDVPWVTVESTATNQSNIGQAFAVEMGVKLFSKAVGIHLEYETKEMVKRLGHNIPWGPGSGETAAPVVTARPAPRTPAMKTNFAQPTYANSYGYMDYGKKDFSAVMISVSTDRNGRETQVEIPMAKAGDKTRMDMDLSKMSKGGEGMPSTFNRISVLYRGDTRTTYTLYPNSNKYMTSKASGDSQGPFDKPRVEKTKVGSEIIDNHPADKYKVKIIYSDGQVQEGFFWNANDLEGMTIKSDIENSGVRVLTELKNIVLKTPPASLFEIPAGYTEAQSFMDLTQAK